MDTTRRSADSGGAFVALPRGHTGPVNDASHHPAASDELAAAEGRSLVPRRVRRLLRLGSQGGWAVVDQALFAGSNLLVNVLLARWLPGKEYGAFVTAYTVLLLVQIAHAALLIEPMLIFGADKHRGSFSHYFDVLRTYHWKLMLAAGGGLAVTAMAIAVFVDTLVGEALAGLAVTSPFILLSWLARRGCLAASKPHLAAFGSAINVFVVLAGLLLLSRLHLLNVLSAQLLLGVAAIATTACLLRPLRRLTATPLSEAARSTVWSDHWGYARWSSATGVLTWFYSFIYYLVLPKWYGLAASGTLKALLNLVLPILHSDGALVTLLLPQFVRSRRVPGRFSRIVSTAAVGFSIEAACYWLVLVFFGQRLVSLLYGGTFQFDHSALIMIGAIPPLSSLVNILGNALRAREEPERVFWATIAAVVVAGTFGVAAVARAGINGAIVGMVSSSAVQAVVMLWLLSRDPSKASERRSAPVGDAPTRVSPRLHAPIAKSAVTVSAVMPTYNTAAYLPQAIESILSQTFSDWELLIVDDGSSDETASILARFTDARITVHTLPANRGRSAARNVALARAKGRYIAICDSDDVFAPTRFEQQVSFLDGHPDVAVVSGYIRAFSSTTRALMQFPVDQASIRRRFDRGKMGVAHGASMVRLECFERLGGYCEDLSFAEDFELFKRFSQHYEFRTLPDVLLDYRHEVGTASIRHFAHEGCAHRYALYRSSRPDDAARVLTLEEFSHQWRTKLAVYTLDLLRSIHFNMKARLFSSYVLR